MFWLQQTRSLVICFHCIKDTFCDMFWLQQAHSFVTYFDWKEDRVFLTRFRCNQQRHSLLTCWDCNRDLVLSWKENHNYQQPGVRCFVDDQLSHHLCVQSFFTARETKFCYMFWLQQRRSFVTSSTQDAYFQHMPCWCMWTRVGSRGWCSWTKRAVAMAPRGDCKKKCQLFIP